MKNTISPMIKNAKGEEVEQYYLARFRNYNLGYAIYEMQVVEDRNVKKEIFYHTEEKVAELAFQDICKGNFDAKKYPQVGQLKPGVIKFDEKHGEAYYIYQSREQFYKTFLSILTDRANEGWYYYTIKKPKNDFKMTLDEINKIEDTETKEFQMKRFKKQNQEMKNYLEEKEMQDSIKRAVKEKNGKLALSIMEERRGGEYENFEVLDLNEIN